MSHDRAHFERLTRERCDEQGHVWIGAFNGHQVYETCKWCGANQALRR